MSEYTLFSDAQIGMILSRPVLISGISEATAKNGKTFLKISMKDGKTEQTATMFGTTAEELTKNTGVVTGSIAEVELQVSEYQGNKSFTVNHIAFCMNPNVSIDDFIKVPPVSVTAMYDEICSIIRASASNEDGTSIAALTLKILDDYKDKYISSSAAIAVHHNIKGGLIYHCYRMVKAAAAICTVYSVLDKELMVCGAAIHDIGKIWEYKTSEIGNAEFTSNGVLFGHSFLGASLVRKYADKGSYNKEKVQMLTHMILAHHGQQEWGAVACPATAEAMALHYIDNLDAKMYTFEETYDVLEPGQITEKKPFGFDNRIYKPKG